ncbi:MAG TPA: SUMF1/EgtB/PvdO family nonheme iron enzyme, partial [Polyangiaceae bacterium]|nr:SUMF1/EgtB/PvdO family nonheme iron enzyme [Polyangiaceae bacterium]
MTLAHACSEYGITAEQLKDWVCVFRRSVRQALDQQLRSTLSLQGLDVEELSRPEFSGKLSDLGVADLVQTIQHGRKDATITITHSGGPSYIWCQGGEIVDAESGPSSGEPALYRILGLEQGSLVADFGATQRPRRITVSTPRLLLEAATQRDRRTRALARIGDPSAVFVVESSVAARHARDLGPDELAVLSAFDGIRSLEEVVLASELSEPQALEIVIGFLEAGVLTQVAYPLALPEAPTSAAGAGMAMSYQPFAGTLKPAHARPPVWVLVSGAVLCSSLGAVTAIAYADALEQRATAAARAASAGVSAAELAVPPSCPEGQALIHGGRFFMGTDSSHPALQYARPAHAVSVDSFCLEKHEVSVAQYSECVAARACQPAHQTSDLQLDGAEDELSRKSRAWHNEQCNAGKPGRSQYPINCVSHAQAQSYCAFRDSRLATEAEWEFAARGETNRLFPWGNAAPSADHVNACGRECSRWHDE